MPELPEVETVRRGLEKNILGKRFDRVEMRRPDLRIPFPANLKEVMEGQNVLQTMRRGKYILIFLESGAGMVLHLGMSGRVNITREAQKPQKHDHLILSMSDGTSVTYNDARRFGMVFLTSQQEWQNQNPFDAMGPEPLGNFFSGPVLFERLKTRKGPIKTALLDQAVVAGIGNIYACEALYEARIDPIRKACSLQMDETEALAESIKNVLVKAIEAGGSTLKDYQHTNGSLGYFQHQFSVYDRMGMACPDCDCDRIKTKGVQKIVQSGRSTFYCPVRQR